MSTEPGTPGGTSERPARYFSGPEEFRAWLQANHDSAPELWMGLNAKHVEPRGLTWALAVPEALCFGWIDSVSQKVDEDSRRQRWTPRKPTSNWSAVNIAHVERLRAEGRMHPAGEAAFARRTDANSGVYAYENSHELDDEAVALLQADAAAAAFWAEATAGYRRICATWIASAKRAETRRQRREQLVADCAAGRQIPSQRYGSSPAWLTRAAAAAAAVRHSSTPSASGQEEPGDER